MPERRVRATKKQKPLEPLVCPRCKEKVGKDDEVLRCPECEEECCTAHCIAGAKVACFECEEGEGS